MDRITDAMDMVDHMSQPAFCVKDRIIVKVNPAAAAGLIEPGIPVSDLLQTGQEEYADFGGGCLYLTLSLCGQAAGACVTRKKDFDLFLLDRAADNSELQAMALAARELREPLSSIMITASRLFPTADIKTPEEAEQIARMNRSLFQLLRIVSNMSDANRFAMDTGVRQEVRDICAIVNETVEKVQNLSEFTEIRVDCALHPEPVYSLVDAEKLERAIYNIISNALKFTPEGGTLQISLTRRENKLYFSVLDSGCGIPENLRSGIFSRYTREPGVEDGRFGIGLGLVLIRSAAALHGGTVLVDHPQGGGTRITMTMAVRPGNGRELRSPVLKVDYAGERDHGLLELSDILPVQLYDPKKVD